MSDVGGASRLFVVALLFWSGAAGGAAAFDALLQLTGARWSDAFRPLVRTVATAVAAAVVLLLFVSVRDALVLLTLAVAAFVLFRRGSTGAAILTLIAFTFSMSVLAIDVIMREDPQWTSTLFPAYFAVTNLYAGVAVCVVLAALAGALDQEDRARDAGKLVLGFALVWAYLFWSQYLVSWYGNLPDDFRFMVERMHGRWHGVAATVIVCCFALPFLLLVARRSRATVTAASIVALAGIWLERLLLVFPPHTWRWTDAFIAVATTAGLGILVSAAALALRRAVLVQSVSRI